MKPIYFLTLDDALILYKDVIDIVGGKPGIRDKNLLESAIAQPQLKLFEEYVYNDIYDMASAYCFHIIKNHPFVDGNKRLGILAALTFLEKNGFEVDADMDELYLLAMHTAESKLSKDEIAVFFRKVSKKITKSRN